MGTAPGVARLAGLVVACLLCASCIKTISPARTTHTYLRKAAHTAEVVVSAVETARLVAKSAGDGKAFGPYTSVMLSEQEEQAGQAQDTFESVQPPNARSDKVRDHLGTLLNKVSDQLSALRIAARRGELDKLSRLARPLRELSKKLNKFIENPE